MRAIIIRGASYEAGETVRSYVRPHQHIRAGFGGGIRAARLDRRVLVSERAGANVSVNLVGGNVYETSYADLPGNLK
jgi:hypothetical protein